VYSGYGFSSCARVMVGSSSDDERGMMPKGSPAFGSITSAGDPRVLQLAVRLLF
jgi:hypothetical protein